MEKSKKFTSPKKKKVDKQQPVGLFDHVKHIRQVQNPDYYNNLSEPDRKSFNHFIILRALSMDPKLLDTISLLYAYFDKIPSPQFYKLLISLIPKDRGYYPWIKAKQKYKAELIDMMAQRFEVSNNHASEYIDLLNLTDEGRMSLTYICQGFGKSVKEIGELLSQE